MPQKKTKAHFNYTCEDCKEPIFREDKRETYRPTGPEKCVVCGHMNTVEKVIIVKEDE